MLVQAMLVLAVHCNQLVDGSSCFYCIQFMEFTSDKAGYLGQMSCKPLLPWLPRLLVSAEETQFLFICFICMTSTSVHLCVPTTITFIFLVVKFICIHVFAFANQYFKICMVAAAQLNCPILVLSVSKEKIRSGCFILCL